MPAARSERSLGLGRPRLALVRLDLARRHVVRPQAVGPTLALSSATLTMHRRSRFVLTAGLLLSALTSGFGPSAHAQGVGIDPNMVVVTHQTRSGSLTLLNTRAEPVEVELTVQYGWAGTDAKGQSNVVMPDTVGADEPDATKWVTIHPRRLTIAPQADQTVKFLVRPPAGLPEGEYWSRVVIRAKTGVAQVEKIGADTAGITVGLTMETRTVIPLFYRQGRVSAGVIISNVRAERTAADSVTLGADFLRDGNAAWLGTVTASLLDASGKVVATTVRNHAAYKSTSPRYTLPVAAPLPPGPYTVRFDLRTERADVQRQLRIPTTGASATAQIVLP